MTVKEIESLDPEVKMVRGIWYSDGVPYRRWIPAHEDRGVWFGHDDAESITDVDAVLEMSQLDQLVARDAGLFLRGVRGRKEPLHGRGETMSDYPNWTNGEPLVATAYHVRISWGGRTDNFRCGFCGHKIAEGERWCFVYTNDMPGYGGNPFSCCGCIDAAGGILEFTASVRQSLRERWREKCEEWTAFIESPKWWQFRRNYEKRIKGDG